MSSSQVQATWEPYLEGDGLPCVQVAYVHYVRGGVADVIVEEDIERIAVLIVQQHQLARVRSLVATLPERMVVLQRQRSITGK